MDKQEHLALAELVKSEQEQIKAMQYLKVLSLRLETDCAELRRCLSSLLEYPEQGVTERKNIIRRACIALKAVHSGETILLALKACRDTLAEAQHYIVVHNSVFEGTQEMVTKMQTLIEALDNI